MFKAWQFLIINAYTLPKLMTLLFFLNNENSVTDVKHAVNLLVLLKVYNKISEKIVKSCCEIAGIDVLKAVQMALCSNECVNLKTNTIKILRIHFSYNRRRKNDDNYRRYIIKIEKLVRWWRMRQLKIEGKNLILKL